MFLLDSIIVLNKVQYLLDCSYLLKKNICFCLFLCDRTLTIMKNEVVLFCELVHFKNVFMVH